MKKSDAEWKKILTNKQFKVLRKKNTEFPFTGKLLNNKKDGKYYCAGCGRKLFNSKTKFESGSGWPSFYDSVSKGAVKLKSDSTLGVLRTEVICGECGGHLGHLFYDGPKPTGKRFCINSIALEFRGE
jgi:peptide-methionine (R)-S-oxide reductase